MNASTDHYKADLSSANLTVKKPTLNWTPVQPAADQTPALEPRANFPITVLDDTRYMILGGAPINATLLSPAIIYDSSKNAWTHVTNPPFYMSSGAMVSSDANTVWAYGGTLNNTPAITPPNMLFLDLTRFNGVWTTRANSVSSPGSTRHGHAAVIRDSQIYFIGGYFATSATASSPVPMSEVAFYNTVSDQWGLILCNGTIPRNRTSHTATLINGSSTVLIYGGAGSDRLQDLPLLDYAYLWDLDNHIYVKLDSAPGDPGALMGHTAVQYQDTILISFGFDGGGNFRNTTYALDVTNPKSPTWGSTTSTTPVNHDDDNQTNTGAIAGGVVGGVAGIAIIAGAFIYYRRKKKNQSDQNDFDLYQPPQGFHTDDSPTLFTSSDGNRYSEVASNNGAAAATGAAAGADGADATEKDNNGSPPHALYSTDPVPNYNNIKPDEGHAPASNDFEPMTRVKPSGND
ncbi:hypothetical protein BCR42DRAFT_419812 [Absidia repens]|uniref:Galactose oxidase n=1 Tax=Absidia repens TaxID=90262 RepID=A0A1X2IAC1_9FUNG|nr:hypothetical protein BCR42DRAFT_419812 [Absidia repens]